MHGFFHFCPFVPWRGLFWVEGGRGIDNHFYHGREIRPRTDLDRSSLSPPKNDSFGASEAHAANTSPCRFQVRSGNVVSIVLWPQSANDDDTCSNVNVGLRPQDVLASLAQESPGAPGRAQGEPRRAQDSSGETRGAPRKAAGSPRERKRALCALVRMATFIVQTTKSVICTAVRVAMFFVVDGHVQWMNEILPDVTRETKADRRSRESGVSRKAVFVAQCTNAGRGLFPSGKERGRVEEEEHRERQVRNEIAQEVVVGTKKKASALVRMKTPSRPHKEQLGKVSRQNWDSSQIDDRDEEEILEWHRGGSVERTMGGG